MMSYCMSAALLVILLLVVVAGAIAAVVVLQKKGTQTIAPTVAPTTVPAAIVASATSVQPSVAPASAAPVTAAPTASPTASPTALTVPVPTALTVPVPTAAQSQSLQLFSYPAVDAPGSDLGAWPITSFPYASLAAARSAYPSMVGWVNDGHSIWLKSYVGQAISTSVPGMYLATFAAVNAPVGSQVQVLQVTGDMSPARYVPLSMLGLG